MTYPNGSVSQPIDLYELEKYNTTNNTQIEEEILSQATTVPLEPAEPIDNSGVNICTNLRFDYKKLKWTDNEFVENRNFILKWERRFGGFWYNTENKLPTQPYQPGTNWKILLPPNAHRSRSQIIVYKLYSIIPLLS